MKAHSGTRKAYWLRQLTFLAPSLLFFTVFTVFSFVAGLYYSSTKWNGLSSAVEWVGLQNYLTLGTDELFLQSFLFSAKFTLVSVIVTNLLAFFLALVLSEAVKGRGLLRAGFVLPNVISGLVLGFIWQFIFVRGFDAFGRALGVEFLSGWLGDETTAFWGMAIVFVWQNAGYMMVIYIAGLSNILQDLREAAAIDGAGAWKRFTAVTFPLVMPAITVCLFMSLAAGFKLFEVPFAMTRGGPYSSTRSITMDIYFEAFTNGNYGLGGAKAVVFFAVVALVTLIQVSLTKRKEVQL